MKALINARLTDFSTYLDDGYLLYDDHIRKIGPMSEYPLGDHQVIDCHHHFVLPGLISGHTHLYSAFSRGLNVFFRPNNFQEILDQLWWKLDRHLDLERSYYSALTFGAEFLKNGVTTVIDHHAAKKEICGSLNSIKKALVDKLGMRAILAFETSDRFPLEDCIEENLRFYRENSSIQVSGLFGMHASMSLSDASLERIKEAIGGIPIHVHVAESEMDQADAIKKYHQTVVKRFARHGLITPDSLLVHCVHVDDEELAIIKESKAVVAVNLISNQNNGVGLPDISKMINMGIPVILGNDGFFPSMTPEYLALLPAMHHRKGSPKGFLLTDWVKIIQETARYASRRLKITLGSFDPGSAADFQIIPYQPMTPIDSTNLFSHLYFGLFPQMRPESVFIGGKKVVDHGTVLGLDPEDILSSQAVAHALWKEIQEEGEMA